MIGLDTSVTVRLLVGDPEPQAAAAHRLLEKAGTAAPLLLSDLVIAETYFALRHHYAVPHGRAVSALRALLNDPRVQATGVARGVLGALPDRDLAPGLIDRLIHGDYAHQRAELVTFDRDAAKLDRARLLT